MIEPTGQTYELKSFADLLALEFDQVKRFADELPLLIQAIKFTNSLLHDCGVDGAPVCSLDSLTWCDDSVKAVTATLHTVENGEVSESGVALFTIEAVKKEEPHD